MPNCLMEQCELHATCKQTDICMNSYYLFNNADQLGILYEMLKATINATYGKETTQKEALIK